MGGLFSPSSPPPPPPPEPSGPSAEELRREELERLRRGISSTVTTTRRGLLAESDLTPRRKQLLGE